MRSNTSARPPRSGSDVRSGTLSRGSRPRAGDRSKVRDDVHRRAADLKLEVETAIHVLDNGINRTPMPLQQRHSVLGMRGSQGMRESMVGSDITSSIFRSSFLASADGQSGSRFAAGSGLSSYLQSDSSSIGRHGRHPKERGGPLSMESSMQSLSIAGGSVSQMQLSLRGSDNSGSVMRGDGVGSAIGVDLGGVVEQRGILDEAVYVRPKLLTDTERRVWLRARTTVRLRETPTIFLYNRQDEAVPNESPAQVDAVREKNKDYTELVEAHRVDEGTRFQERGAATFAAAKKSIHCEMHPPGKVDAGALQVTPWMLKDEFAPLMDDADDAEDGDGERAATAGAQGEGLEEDAELADDMEESEMQNEESVSAGPESASADQSGRPSTDGTRATKGSGGSGGSGGCSRQWMLADSLMSNLRIMERAVVQNIMEKTQLAYRGVNVAADAGRLTAKNVPLVAQQSPRRAAQATTATSMASTIAGMEGTSGGATDATAAAAAATTAVVSFPQNELPALTASDGIRALWRYHSPQTRGRAVTCMAWNRKEVDILAVGYSPRRPTAEEDEDSDAIVLSGGGKDASPTLRGNQGSTNNNKDSSKDVASLRGLVCCWSLKNPLAPELVLQLTSDAGVSSLAFSLEHPSLLAVGNTAGGIVVYDIQKDLATPSITPAVSTGLHTGAVWDLKWVSNGKERGEFLMSISADGRVVQWAVGKAVEKVAPDLIHLKRQPGAQVENAFVEGVAAAEEAAAAAAAARRRGGAKINGSSHRSGFGGAVGGAGGGKEDAVLSRQAGGMCFDVCPTDQAIYVVGTDDGSVLQCNRSQTESYDLDYSPHAELVYRIRWSPYSARYFLTCSADWTTRLYQLGHQPPIVRFDSPNQDAVQDVAWSSSNALFFATVTAQGNVELWSAGDTVYPRATVRYDDHRRLNCLLFADQDTPVVVVGDDEGDVTVFLLRNSIYGRQGLTDDEQEMWLEETVKKST